MDYEDPRPTPIDKVYNQNPRLKLSKRIINATLKQKIERSPQEKMQRHPALLKSVGSADTLLLCGDKTTSDIYCKGVGAMTTTLELMLGELQVTYRRKPGRAGPASSRAEATPIGARELSKFPKALQS